MRILQISPHYIPAYHFGGVPQVVHSLSKSLVMQGHTVHVCTTNLKNRTEDLDVSIGEPAIMDGVHVHYSPTLISRYWGFSLMLAQSIWQQVSRTDVVMIHFHYQFASLIGGWICCLRRKPYIIFTHGSLNKYGVALRSRFRKRFYLCLLERGNFKQALFAAYQSPEELDNSLQFGRCEIVPIGIDPEVFRPLPPRFSLQARHPEIGNRLVYLYLGRLDAGKGLEILLPAFRRLVERQADAHLVIAGGNERGYETVLRHLVTELDLAERVTFTGLVSGPDKLAVLQDADVFVLPSRSEALSLSSLEAMYMGLPVVVSNRVGLWRTIQQKRLGWVVPLDESALADALTLAARSPDRRTIGQRGHELVRSQYTSDAIAQDLVVQIQTAIEMT